MEIKGSIDQSGFNPEIVDKAQIVSKCMSMLQDGRQEDSCLMHARLVENALGPAFDHRDSCQMRGVGLIGKRMTFMHETYDDEVELLSLAAEQPESALQKLLSDSRDADDSEKAADLALQAAKQDLAEARMEVDAAGKEAERHKAAQVATTQLLQRRLQERDSADSLYHQHFVPLQEGRFESTQEAQGHVDAIVSALSPGHNCKTSGVAASALAEDGDGPEHSLLAAFGVAAKLWPRESLKARQTRRAFDNVTMEKLGACLRPGQGQKVEQNAREAQEQLDQANAALAEAMGVLHGALDKERGLGAPLQQASNDLRKKRWKAQQLRDMKAHWPDTPEKVKNALSASKKRRASEEDKELAAFKYLRDRYEQKDA